MKRGTLPVLAAAIACLVGCASPRGARIEARTQVDPERMPRMVNRLAVVNHLARAEEDWGNPFSRHMAAYLDRYGVVARVQTRSPLEVESDKRAHAAELREFEPLVVLVVEPGPGVISPRGEHLEHTFQAGLIPYPPSEDGLRRVVWKARVTVHPAGFQLVDADLKDLAAALMRAMIEDGVLPPSPLSSKSAGGSAPAP